MPRERVIHGYFGGQSTELHDPRRIYYVIEKRNRSIIPTGALELRRGRIKKNENQRIPRQLNVLIGTTPERNTGLIERMKQKIDSDKGRATYSRRLGIGCARATDGA